MRLKLLVVTFVMICFSGTMKSQIICTTYPCFLCMWGGPMSVEVPNIFSPNYDGINDVWRPKVLNDLCLTDFKVTIFNRWGIQVFESYVHSSGWNGNEGTGTACPDGSYYYIMSYSNGFTKEKRTLKGFVQLVR